MRFRARDASGQRVRCSKWAVRPETVRFGEPQGFCAYHLEAWRKRSRRRGIARGADNVKRMGTMPVAYSKHLSQTLAARLEELADRSPVELLDMTEELRLAKSTIADVTTLYDLSHLALETAETAEKKQVALNACIGAGSILRDTILSLGEVTAKAAGALAAQKAFVGVQDIPAIAGQMVNAVREELGDDDPALVMRIAERLRTIRLPSSGPQGTEITPDMEAEQMDQSVPRVAHDVPQEEEEAA